MPVFETGSWEFEPLRAGHIKENALKTITFKNRFNGERVVCKDLKAVQVIDGIEYLLVSKTVQDRKFLMRKDALEKIKV